MAQYPDWEVGDIVTADLLDAMVAKYTYKSSATARNTTTTLTADPELTGIALEVGTFDIEMVIFWTQAATAPKLKTRWGFTGTISDTIRLCHGPGNNNVAGPQDVTETTVRGYALSSQDAIYSASTSTAYSAVLEKAAGVVVSVAGTLSLNWAQQASNASNVTVQPSSYVKVRRVS